ncbi:hypothetical protein BMF94_4031, partial [Rhodotorula taiwanensis]
MHFVLPAPFIDPASWIPKGFLLALLLWALRHQVQRPAFGWDVWRDAQVPGGQVQVLGIGRHSASVVLIHGLGGNAAQLLEVVAKLRPELLQVAFVLPSAAPIALTARNGSKTSAWFDVDHFPTNRHAPLPTGPADIAGMIHS